MSARQRTSRVYRDVIWDARERAIRNKVACLVLIEFIGDPEPIESTQEESDDMCRRFGCTMCGIPSPAVIAVCDDCNRPHFPHCHRCGCSDCVYDPSTAVFE